MKSSLKKTIWPIGSKRDIIDKYTKKKQWDKVCKKYSVTCKINHTLEPWWCCFSGYLIYKKVCINRVTTGKCPFSEIKKCNFFNQWRLSVGDKLEEEIKGILSDIVEKPLPKNEAKVVITPTLTATESELDDEKPVNDDIKIDKNARGGTALNLMQFIRMHKTKKLPELCKMAIFALKNGQIRSVKCQYDLKALKGVIKVYRRRALKGL